MQHLYRHFDKDGVLLYVGVSLSAIKRLGEHQQHSHWFGLIYRVEIEPFETRQEVLAAERAVILTEKPKYNVKIPVCVAPKAGKWLSKKELKKARKWAASVGLHKPPANELRRWLDAATLSERDALVRGAGTTLGALRQQAGGYRYDGGVNMSAELASSIEVAARSIHREGLPELRRIDLCRGCFECEFAQAEALC